MGRAGVIALLFLPLITALHHNDISRACNYDDYRPTQFKCDDGHSLCPVLKCGSECYSPVEYSCRDGHLSHAPETASSFNLPATSSTTADSMSSSGTVPTSTTANGAVCSSPPTTQYLEDGPYANYFLSDCNSAGTVVVTSPLPGSDLSVIGPRVLVAWPAGNSGVVAFFAPQNGVNGSLAVHLVNDTASYPLLSIYEPANSSSLTGRPRVGLSTLLSFNESAILTVPILGSVRTLRDFIEGPSILVPRIQNAIRFSTLDNGGALLSRLWLDNETTTEMSFQPLNASDTVKINNRTLEFAAGVYNFTATFDFPQLTQLNASAVLSPQSQFLIQQRPDQTTSLSFLSYTQKLLAGTWRFLTYFGRDSMISLLLMQDILSEGQGGAVEAVISAVLERLNKTDGSACHEETIGDYATYLNEQHNISGSAPNYDYKMIDTDFFLPVVIENYFVGRSTGRVRREAFFATQASIDPDNVGLSYADLARISAEKIMNITFPFAQLGGQVRANLIHLKPGEVVGDWRDSTYGIGGGRIPYDVNTALVPAALRAIASLSAAGFFPEHPEWNITATANAQIWEDSTLDFFSVTVPAAEARSLVTNYTTAVAVGFPSYVSSISSDIHYHALALQGNNDQDLVKVMNSDDCFRHFLLNTTNQRQLTAFINQTASNILNPFPVGLGNPVGLLVANPAYGGNPVYAANWTNNAYHGTVVWGWQMSMMAAGLERQISRCNSSEVPDFCSDVTVRANVIAAYKQLWAMIESNSESLSSEVWSWVYNNGYQVESLGALPPPPGSSPTESDIRQLWSLTFLAVTRNERIR